MGVPNVTPGIVIAPRVGSAWVTIRERGCTIRVLARNHLNLRAPPSSRVTVARDEGGGYVIVGRER